MRQLFAILLILVPTSLWAVPLTIDNFEDGTTQGWIAGNPAGGNPVPPVNVGTGGPAGAGDAYLQVTAIGGNDAGSQLSVFNMSQWTGDFTGLSGVAMDVKNFGPDDLVLRLLLVNFPDGGGPPISLAWTLAGVPVASGSGWMDAFFSLAPGNLFSPLGGVALTLSDVDELRIFHNPVPAFGGPGTGAAAVNAVLGVDNIQAVPEPSSMLLVLSGIGAVARRLRRRSAA